MFRFVMVFLAMAALSGSIYAGDCWQELAPTEDVWAGTCNCSDKNCICSTESCDCNAAAGRVCDVTCPCILSWVAYPDGDPDCTKLLKNGQQIGAYRFSSEAYYEWKENSFVKSTLPIGAKSPVQVLPLTDWQFTQSFSACANGQCGTTVSAGPMQDLTVNADGGVTAVDVQSGSTRRVGPIRRLLQRIRSRRAGRGSCG